MVLPLPLKDDNPTRTKPVVTWAIIAACIYIFAVVQPHDPAKDTEFVVEHAAIPCEITHGQPISNSLSAQCDGRLQADLPAQQEFFPHKNIWLSILVSMFLHGSWLHVLGNMLFLWIFGNNVEDRFGKVRYTLFYLVCGIAASAAHIATQPNSTTPVIGASGAIAGVMGAYLVLYPRARVLTMFIIIFFIQFIYLPAYVVLLAWFVMQFFTNPNTGVAVAAHIGGFIIGAGITMLARPFLHSQASPPPSPPEPGFGFGGSPYR
jgi:membrane associated rhomboid family serine protease